MMLKEGDKAPIFALPDIYNKIVALSNFTGRKVVLYFYPKDNTPGCTMEARDFNALLDDFHANNTVVLGVSKDSIASHQKFVESCMLNFMLLSDHSGEVCEQYGVWKERSMYGKKYMGIERSTFFIGENGLIQKVWKRVSVPGHAAEVLQLVRSRNSGEA